LAGTAPAARSIAIGFYVSSGLSKPLRLFPRLCNDARFL
jgi:hypothetical protein